MGKNRDLILILSLVVVGMFIPFLGSIIINYGLNLVKIGSTFGHREIQEKVGCVSVFSFLLFPGFFHWLTLELRQ